MSAFTVASLPARLAHAGQVAPVGELAQVSEPIAPGGLGRAELRGTSWAARNVGDRPIEPGSRARAISVDGLTLEIVAEP